MPLALPSLSIARDMICLWAVFTKKIDPPSFTWSIRFFDQNSRQPAQKLAEPFEYNVKAQSSVN